MTDDHLGGRAHERALLTGFLDWYRSVVEHKVEGLAHEDAARVVTPSGLSPLGVVQHLGHVESTWFRWRFAGEDVELLYDGDDNSIQFRLDPDDTAASIVDFYREQCAQARRVTDAASLDDLSARPSTTFGLVSLRWILVHMLEETARHTGHLDLMRENIDGRTGD